LDVAAFLCHEAAEKALKALFIRRFKKLWKTHDLFELAKKLRADKKIVEISKELNPHYIATRYPVVETYSKEDVERYVKLAEEVIRWAEKETES
jgi:HEPN domain-containing protein